MYQFWDSLRHLSKMLPIKCEKLPHKIFIYWFNYLDLSYSYKAFYCSLKQPLKSIEYFYKYAFCFIWGTFFCEVLKQQKHMIEFKINRAAISTPLIAIRSSLQSQRSIYRSILFEMIYLWSGVYSHYHND